MPLSGCFNPCRVFSGLATVQIEVAPPIASEGFNPCRVFSGLATISTAAGWFETTKFQSLSGFFRPCNLPYSRYILIKLYHVSIPVGFFQALQLRARVEDLLRAVVSIPVGFFQALQRRIRGGSDRMKGSFNPCRVFSGLATHVDVGRSRNDQQVSIPVGFFQALQLGPRRNRSQTLLDGFNPCRVFSGLATLRQFN